MSRNATLAATVVLALGCTLAGSAALAHPGGEGMRGMGAPQDRTAMRERMRDADTPEARQAIAQAHRDEMHKRMAARHADMPQGMGMGRGMGQPPQTAAPETHAH